MGPLRPGGVYLILNLVVLDVAVGWNFMTFPKFIRSNISEVILNKNAYGWGGVSLAFFLPLCRPARAFEARSKKYYDYGVHDVKFDFMIEYVS